MIETPHSSETDALDPRLAFDNRAHWVRMQTLARLRWIAVLGQVISVIVACGALGLDLETGLIVAAIGAAVITNLMATMAFPENRRLSETELAATLAFDMVQLWTLLLLTGGLHNPFALFVLAQVAIAALALSARRTFVLCAVAIVLWTALVFVHLPLTTHSGEVMQLPPVFVLGFWVAIVIAILFQGAYAHRVTSELTAMSDALTATQMALSREQKLTDLGGVVAAAAHELGTPLATIVLVASEMIEDAPDEDTRADAQLVRDQAERCRVILRGMGQAGKQDEHIKVVPLVAVVEEAADPHKDRGIDVVIETIAHDSTSQPSIARRPDVIHGLRNLVQNAVDFAAAEVLIEVSWSADEVAIRISDDGPGYPPEALPRLGDPFLRKRREGAVGANRQGYEGMGLGLFIAKTLLERSRAELAFANGRDGGAVVHAAWRRSDISVATDRAPLGENRATT
ncbi:two-component system, sensor histidine kinase RegB [Palleronia marisminoris]|uniref:histidine kinase n=1 Tax=Palleronia marisminoris TaxID=315423 RepID=A0A1Y5T1J5_9RHOB|nr:ActS/PrrB/RegB family redox-sensitive histidine kinase [Palleronia marisminoris]SFH07120.1 two-component system, sensor histidine kinase RegB [Palleronia marisminoris]SLN51695.1 Sensor histidine kinase RegB [Palleronia marisminoris]